MNQQIPDLYLKMSNDDGDFDRDAHAQNDTVRPV
ncbi:hypothetical protein ES702_01578 [subsurface metagenome]